MRDRVTGRMLAWKTLGERASLDETRALVREATALGDLDGLGSPRIVAFGQTPKNRKPFLVREMVTGESLSSLLSRGDARTALRAVLQAAEKLTVLHRAQLLHGDVKPANIIVGPDGTATWVDLGLVTQLVEGGVRPLGLTVLYAAPELLAGGALTVRAEVFALGATLRDVANSIKLDPPARAKLDELVARATSPRPEERFPSVDELAEELRPLVAAPLPKPDARAAWPILGLDAAAAELQDKVLALARSGALALTGERGSGRTTLIERLAFTLAISGESTALIDSPAPEGTVRMRVLELELAGRDPSSCFIFVDDAGSLPSAAWDQLSRFREQGSRIVFVAEAEVELRGSTCAVFAMPPLAREVVRELTLRAIPSLGEAALREIEERAGGSPARLREIALRLAQQPIVDREDVVLSLEAESAERAPPGAASLRSLLERGHFERAWEELGRIPDATDPEIVVLRARLLLNRGDWRGAIEALDTAPPPAGAAGLAAEAAVERSRAWLRGGEYVRSQETASSGLATLANPPTPQEAHARVELSSTIGLCRSFSADHAGAKEWLLRAVEEAAPLGDPRSMSIAKGSLAFALQRAGDLGEAARTYAQALEFAELAGDAGAVATTRLNLAGVSKAMGDIAAALEHLAAAVDMGKKSGRRATLRQALLNLANLDLYLGRLARARASIDELAAERHELPPHFAAQLDALSAEHAAKSGRTSEAILRCDSCAAAYLAMGRPVDSAEALLESCFAILDAPGASAELRLSLQRRLHEAEALLSNTQAHRPALDLARARVARAGGSDGPKLFDDAVASAEASGKKEWLAKAYVARAELREQEGQRVLARRDREAALLVFEEISAKLPRDLREVFWDEPARRRLRDAADSTLSVHGGAQSVHVGPRPAVTSHEVRSLREDRLSRILDINREIAGTYDLSQLLDRVTDHAIHLLSAERGFVLLRSAREGSRPGEFSVHASRDQSGEDVHARFSQSIAERVVSTGEPFVTTSARDDARMADYVSVHQLMLQSIACVPIRARSKGVIGALYVETRLSTAARFGEELSVLGALADQVGIAIETARLVSENERRAEELERANKDLTAARERLEELLGHRTAQLQATRRDLKSARAVLKSHFGYQGLVGTSEAQRKLYALIDRIKDTDVPVLITGESGTGKEVVARAIHNASPRAKHPFLGLNCGAIPEHLLESELFGHVRGAFTGADRDRRGLFKEATDGTLLLDEIGEMPPKMQAGLLRVLQEKVVRPVGGAREESVETRVIAATHRDLEGMVQRGTFREDLFYRLNVIQVRVPSLRERVDDIPVLIDHFLGIFAARYHRDRRSVSRPALKMLMAHRWPGNVRQLENALLNAWVLSEGPELMPEDFELSESTGAVAPRAAPEPGEKQSPTSLDLHRASERERILDALSTSNWNRVRAAELVGMPRRTFYRRLKEYGIQ